jgi:signal transduction histidine kinase/CheY-like chemotaxis protein
MRDEQEDQQLRAAALRNVESILKARQQADEELRRTKEALEEETRILELLNATGASLASNLDLQSLVQAVTDAGVRLSGAQFGAFFYTLSDASGEVFTLYTLSGAPREAFERFPHPRNTPVFGPTFNGEGVIRLDDVRADPRYGQMGPYHGMPPGHLPVCSYLAVPVITRAGEVIGGLFFGHRERAVFSERSERLIVGIAAQAANAIDNARLYEQAKRSAEERARGFERERAARAELERVSLIKDEFLATLSHELRTPLNAVLGWAEVLLMRNQGPADADTQRGLETIARNARSQAKLIDDLLDMNRIVSGKLRLDVQPVDLAQVVSAALHSVQPSADAKAIHLRSTVDPNSGPVFGDPHRLQQVVWNLLTNAVKFTPMQGKIDLLVQRVDSHVEIVVQDSGIGLAPAFLPHIFGRFRQADSSSTRQFGGLGLGLSIVKQLVELHGGRVRAESAGEGRGATFSVSLPLRAVRERDAGAGAEPSPRSSAASDAELSLAGIKVLVVDDEPDARELVRWVLTDVDAEVVSAGSADEAFALMQAQRPDVIVSDIGMPGRDGYQLMREVRALPAAGGGKTPAIALTAFARTEDRTRAMLAGFQVHVAKPIEPSELVATIKSLAGNRG